MINNLQSHKLLFRDGTSQQDRNREPLQPEFVQVEDRSMEDLIAEAQELAKELRFFDEQNNPVFTWETFLIGDASAYLKASEGGRKIQREQWARQLAAYVEDPERFRDDSKTLASLSRPHSVLFMTFLKLLNHVKSQINGLTQKHLDFYFRERLSLTPKEAVPDMVNVLLELTEDIERLEVKKDTVLLAGEDEEGNELHYKIDEDTLISQARIVQLKNAFIDKQIITIRVAHLNNIDTPDNGFTSMMEMALGNPNPGDPLPPLPNGVDDLPALNILVQQDNEDAKAYVTGQLFLSLEDFGVIIQKHLDDLNGIATDWQEVYDMLDQAFKNRFRTKRQQELKALHENESFDSMIEQVYGDPLPGDDLPLYRGNPADFTAIDNDRTSTDPGVRQEALEYMLEELKLTEQDFVHIIQTRDNVSLGEEDWDKVYRILERASRQVRSIALPSPTLEKLSDIYAAPDAKANAFSQYGDEEESTRFKTFGSRQPGVELPLQPADMGFAVSAPVLQLREGKRKITALVDFGAAPDDVDSLQSVFNQPGFAPFQLCLSSEGQWFQPEHTFMFGNFIGAVESTYEGSFNGQIFTFTSGVNFNDLDIGKYLVSTDDVIYEIVQINAPDEVTVQEIGNLDPGNDESFGATQKIAPEQLYLNALKVIIELSEEDLPVVPFGPTGEVQYLRSEHPALVFLLHHVLEDQTGEESHLSRYQELMHLQLNKLHLQVDVQGIKNITLQNDQSTIDSKKPFEPFGSEPDNGSNFYLANEELSRKRLDELELELQWAKQPGDFAQHYDSYWKIEADDPDLPSDDDTYIVKGNDSFRAQVFLHDNNAEVPVTAMALFPEGGKAQIQDIPGKMPEGYQYRQDPDAEVGDEDALEWDRYFRLELEPLDFQHTVHNSLFARQALSGNDAIRSLRINPPYEPKLKSLRVGYSAHIDILPGETSATPHDKLYHIHPFGFKELNTGEIPKLLPAYTHQGTLYIGLSRLEKPQVLSMLFQMAAGSANPDVATPEVQWSYLRHNEWVVLERSAIVSDTTNGLVNTGIVRIKIPADATTGGTLLPDALHWLKVSAANNIAGISDTIDVMAQAISATLSGEGVAPSHFKNPLSAETITETLEPIPGIEAITQPFTSLKGKPAEQGSALYKRLSERLRHKNRALTMWDYEHIVLNEFPQVYKVKCLSGNRPGKVDVIVVPDIRGSLPFNPFAPKVAADTLFQIREYLDTHAPVHAEVEVLNPFYLQVKTRCTVKFHPGYDESFHKAKLIDEIKRFLAPWAFDEDSDIRIGGTLHASVLINFIAERPYIDYVANMKLFQSEDGKKFIDVRTFNNGKTIVIPARPDMVLVSAQSHTIDIVDENGYDEDNFEGVNYMEVELDFEVGEDLV